MALAMGIREPPTLPAARRAPFFWKMAGFPPVYKRYLLALALFTLGNSSNMFLLLQAIESAGYRSGEDVMIALPRPPEASTGMACTTFARGTQGGFGGNGSDVRRLVGEVSYHRPRGRLGRRRLGWLEILNRELGGKIELVGDDIFVTNVERIQRGIDENIANAVLIKLNQIGTLSESVAAVNLAYGVHWGAMVSHRSGETVDSFIADLTVALATGHLKTGSPWRGERVEKYNQLIMLLPIKNQLS